jgi:hypothetical protein
LTLGLQSATKWPTQLEATMSHFIFPEDRTPKAWLRAQQTEDFESATMGARLAGAAIILGLVAGIAMCIAAFAIATAVYL